MLSKLLSLTFFAVVVGYLFFRPQLRQIGQRLDRIVSLMVVAIVITWAGQLLYFWLTRH
jgi:preprotein translocase subunit YajC